MTKRKPELDHQAIGSIKTIMDYEDGTKCCKVCKYFGPDELIGGCHDALPARCERNVFWFPVSEAGKCREFLKRNVAAEGV